MDKNSPAEGKDLEGIKELYLHYIWSEGLIPTKYLYSTDQQKIKIIFPGWYNRGWGADFKSARIQIGTKEFFGDIEIHTKEEDWLLHKHQQDQSYNQVILHIFIKQSKRMIKNLLGEKLPSLLLPTEVLNFQELSEQNRIIINEPPGACGLILNKHNFKQLRRIIFNASEERFMAKAEKIKAKICNFSLKEQENYLFSSICKALGQTSHANIFLLLADRYPYSELHSVLNLPLRESRANIIARWLGALGMLTGSQSKLVSGISHRDWLNFQQIWSQINEEVIKCEQKAVSIRPAGNPVRKLFGLFYHLQKTNFEGLLKTWLNLLLELEEMLKKDKIKRVSLIKKIEELFPTPEWEEFSSETKLIGKERALIILINAIMPFFFAWVQVKNNQAPQRTPFLKDIEKTIFSIFLLLPPEGKNQKTIFMEKRLFKPNSPFKIKKNLSYYQGLIEVYDSCCHSYYQGCVNCRLLKLLQTKQSDFE